MKRLGYMLRGQKDSECGEWKWWEMMRTNDIKWLEGQ